MTTRSGTTLTFAAVLAVVGVAVTADRAPVGADVSSGDRPVLVPVAPCRLTDTRPAPNTVGPKSSPLGPAETLTIATTGTNGNCTIPATALAVSLNVTALGATEQSFLTFWPDGARPLAASLNPAPGQPPVPNAVTTSLGPDGSFRVYNDTGSVHVVIDVNGYYDHHDHDDRYDTSDEVDTKIADATAGLPGAGTSYTKEESDARYDLSEEVDTKIEEATDGLLTTDDVYTKTESDARYPATDDVYTKTESDSRFHEGDRVVLVPADGTPGENGAALEAALASITDATAADPYLVRLAAGVFDVGSDGMGMVDHVSIAGAGRRATIITSVGLPVTFRDDHATVRLADEVTLSDVLVRNTGGVGTDAVAVVGTGDDFLVHGVRLEVIANGADFASGFAAADVEDSTEEFSGTLDDVDVDVGEGSAPPNNARGIGSRSFNGDTVSLTIQDTRIRLTTRGTGIGELANESFPDGPLIVRNTEIRLEAGGVGVGISEYDPQIFDDIDIEIDGGATPNYGMQSGGSGMRPQIFDSRIVVDGPVGSAGFRTNTSTITVRNSFVQARSIGMESTGTISSFGGTYRFDNTTIDAPTGFAIGTSGSGTYRFQMGGGKLDATTNVLVQNTGTGTVITACVNTWDEDYAPVDPSCT